ncbi:MULTISPECIES: hypothetical protein [Bacillus cereus group]|uniref:Uncharacterized protein n=1 Tax=Bacillus cereus TaxID=1396 RepID=A0A9X7G4S5_BACCE|nr:MULTISPECIES: hypothetical protein [Bacillus cereus group]PEE94775.1 hypothetical protein COM92_11030 [Bacillus cereus]PFV00208.1 hypothetical protein COK98_31545 [Bacillus cereus]PGK65055.1 hypothetical protein CN928_27275 [Bacillus thuringiensis]PGN71707.1 hypothetical protein CN967_25010 [Bacillus cereus]
MFTHKNTYERGSLGEVEAQFLVKIYDGMGCEELQGICLSQTDVYMQKFYLMENGKIIEIEIGLNTDELEWKCDGVELTKEKAMVEIEREISCYDMFQQARIDKGWMFKEKAQKFLTALKERESA